MALPDIDVDGRRVYALSRQEWSDLRLTLRRYYAWVDSGRLADPWDSGVASATRFDKPQTKHHKPSGGYDAGRCAEPEPDANLTRLDEFIMRLPAHDQALLYWRIAAGLSVMACAERLGISVDTVADRWRRLGVRVWHRV